ncbi:hypothetical protein ACUOFC_30525, partial [Escherichia sp. TWPC-MK]
SFYSYFNKNLFNISFSASNRLILDSGFSDLPLGLPTPGPFVLLRFSSNLLIPSASKRFTQRLTIEVMNT